MGIECESSCAFGNRFVATDRVPGTPQVETPDQRRESGGCSVHRRRPLFVVWQRIRPQALATEHRARHSRCGVNFCD